MSKENLDNLNKKYKDFLNSPRRFFKEPKIDKILSPQEIEDFINSIDKEKNKIIDIKTENNTLIIKRNKPILVCNQNDLLNKKN